ncbi:MAG: PilZ domain-containing protein [bacterium]
MEGSFSNRERRSYPRFIIDLPLEYRVMDGPCLRGGIVVNASEGGFLIETTRDIPVGMELNVTVLFPKGFELADFKVVAKIVRKEPYRREDWKGVPWREGYQYGLEFIQISQEDRLKLDLLLSDRYNLEEMLTINEVHTDKEAEF